MNEYDRVQGSGQFIEAKKRKLTLRKIAKSPTIITLDTFEFTLNFTRSCQSLFGEIRYTYRQESLRSLGSSACFACPNCPRLPGHCHPTLTIRTQVSIKAKSIQVPLAFVCLIRLGRVFYLCEGP